MNNYKLRRDFGASRQGWSARGLRLRVSHTLVLGFVLLVGAVPSARAQVNIEALRPTELPTGRSGSVGGNLTVRTGNVDFVQLDIEGRHNVVEEGVTTLAIGTGGIGLLGRSRFASSGLFHFRRTHEWLDWLSPEWYAQVNYDRPQLLRFPWWPGGGGRFGVARGEWGEFGAGTALMMEHERLAVPDTASHPPETTTLRWSNFLTLRVVPSQRLVVTSTSYVQPEFRNPGDVRVLENLRLASSITDTVSLTVAFDLRYDSDPPDGSPGSTRRYGQE